VKRAITKEPPPPPQAEACDYGYVGAHQTNASKDFVVQGRAKVSPLKRLLQELPPPGVCCRSDFSRDGGVEEGQDGDDA